MVGSGRKDIGLSGMLGMYGNVWECCSNCHRGSLCTSRLNLKKQKTEVQKVAFDSLKLEQVRSIKDASEEKDGDRITERN